MRAHITLDHTLDLAALTCESIPASARMLARCSLFDWIVVARAGANQPVSRIIRDFVTDEGGCSAATVVGGTRKFPARGAALANGTISHALDYDDTHFAHVGHPSVAIMPAALAVAEERGAPATKICDAFLLGAEASCRIGMVLGRAHYERGFHQTATAGAFGATVAAGRLLELTRNEMRHALSLVSTRASGLKSQFGTMGKPFNAGISAANGVEAASLASRGFISCDDGVGGVQGFIDTHAEGVSESDAWAATPPSTFIFEDIKYKLHACCHGTHAMLNALSEAKRRSALVPEQVTRVIVNVNPRWLRVCNIRQPRTGLEAKFSYVLLAAMVLRGIDTAADDAYTESLCTDPTLVQLAKRVVVEGHETVRDTAAEVMIELTTGERIAVGHDLAARLPIEPLERGLRAKARALLGEATAERVWSGILDLDRLSAGDLAGLLNG
jgi:2-methylcitrate dehydratase PrpD